MAMYQITFVRLLYISLGLAQSNHIKKHLVYNYCLMLLAEGTRYTMQAKKIEMYFFFTSASSRPSQSLFIDRSSNGDLGQVLVRPTVGDDQGVRPTIGSGARRDPTTAGRTLPRSARLVSRM